jgi:hypothetical protein
MTYQEILRIVVLSPKAWIQVRCENHVPVCVEKLVVKYSNQH